MKKRTKLPRYCRTDVLPGWSLVFSLFILFIGTAVQAAGHTLETICPGAGTVWYVDGSASSGGTGTSWECAFQNLQDAIDAASSGHEIWVKAGTYLPTKDPFGNASPADPRDKTFHLKNGVALYGGFAGTETMRSQRLWATNITTLSGDIGLEGDDSDNSYHVVLSALDDNNNTVLDGFTIKEGKANASTTISVEGRSFSRQRGSGISIYTSNMVIANCEFDNNSATDGGGIYNLASSPGPAITNCSFSNNQVSGYGGGMYNHSSSPVITNCTFSNNTSQYGGGAFNANCTLTFTGCSFLSNSASTSGGGMRNESSTVVSVIDGIFAGNSALSSNGGGFYIGTSSTSATLTNCLIYGNSAAGAGAGIYNSATAITITNCTVSGNKANSSGGGMWITLANPILVNCIFWNNKDVSGAGTANANIFQTMSTPNISYSLIQNQNPSGTGNLNGIPSAGIANYPGFFTPLDPANAPSTTGDFHFQGCSPAADAGTATNAPTTDLDGAMRPFGPGVDIGCYELQTTIPPSSWYADSDNDGYGNPGVTTISCTQPSGYVANNTDCDDNDPLEKPGQTWYADTDNDGYSSGATLTQCLRPTGYKVAGELTATSGDCNDGNAAINPGATEVCDGIDNNCNSMTDEGVQTTYYEDADNDGFGDSNTFTMDCTSPSGFVANDQDCNDNDPLEKADQTWYADADNDGYSNGTTLIQCLRPTGYKVASELTATSGDCNDGNAAINPGATEICDGIDNNCNSMTDEGVQTTYYSDMDMDGFGDPIVSQQACSQPSGYVANNTDCDDNDPLEKPGQTWYADADNDGYSNGTTLTQCLRPTGYKVAGELIATSGDCNDGNAAINPAATEVCDGIDNNCNAMTDEGVQNTYYRDMDNDGFGDPALTQQACSQPSGYVANNTDCDDNDVLEHPGQIWYADADNDGYSTGTTLSQCLRPNGYKAATELTATSGDCNDGNAAINPGALEVCDGIDNNCNSMTDEGVQTTYYRDMDMDGFGDPAVSQQACSQPSGYVANNTDCDDNDPLEKPGQIWYADADNDGYSSGTTLTQCLRPTGYKVAGELTATSGDCNDGNAAINPAATEICDGIDNNCNSMTDEGVQTTYYEDADNDGFGDPNTFTMDCSLPSGFVPNNEDCNDNDPLEKPGQTWYADADNDGYSNGTTLTQCLRPTGYKVAGELTATSGDCNDGNAAINPGATEICDGIDNNCDNQLDNGTLTTYYLDFDNDGFGDPASSQQACSPPNGYVTNNTDCNDNNPLEKPGQTWYADTDNDGYSNGATLTQCLRPAGYKVAGELTATSGDCNDSNAAINPGATEVCDGMDNNCNSMTDEGVGSTYYRDLDNDGFGNPAVSQQACNQPSGYVANNTDCNDNNPLEKPGQTWYADTDNDGYSNGTTLTQCLRPTGYKVAGELTATSGDCNDGNAAINPGATEVCDGMDNNCNSMTDEGVGSIYYRDLDNDGFGNPAVSQQACSQPSGYVASNTDCNDNNPLEKPGQTWYADSDNDGYSSGATLTQCLRPTGYKVAGELTDTSGDCNDGNAAINPGATEICDGMDNNCNSMTDEGVGSIYYRDLDNDGFGNPAVSQQACSQPSGYVANNTDCNDNNPLEKPGQTWYADTDNDGYSNGTTLTQCLRPAGYKVAGELTATSGDCNDGNAAINPGATEVCDGVDNDCDTLVDGNDPNALDNTPPTAVCRQGIIHLTGAQSMVLPEDVLDFNASGDDCGQITVTNIVPAMVTCQQVGQEMNVAVTVSDGHGNMASCTATVAVVKDNTLPPGWVAANIGSTANGTSEFDDCTGSNAFTLQTQGYTTNTSDVEHSVYQNLCGNAEIIAHVSSIFPQGGWAGIQMRESDSQGAKKFTIKTQLGTILRREIRTTTFGPTNTLQVAAPPTHSWFRITRIGSTFNSYSSADGINWVFRSSATISMDACIQVGMFVESINNTTITQAIIDNVAISGASANLAQLPGTQNHVVASQEMALTVFPNPTHGQVSVDFGQALPQDATLIIFDALGSEVWKKKIELSTQREQLDLSALPGGMYLIKVASPGLPTATQRLIVTDH